MCNFITNYTQEFLMDKTKNPKFRLEVFDEKVASHRGFEPLLPP